MSISSNFGNSLSSSSSSFSSLSNLSPDIGSSSLSNIGFDCLSSPSIIGILKSINKANLESLFNHRRIKERPGYFCVLCKKNGETSEFYQSHSLRDVNGSVTCPILLKHVCEICGATGVAAHTRSYCPFNKMTNTKVSHPKPSKKNSHPQPKIKKWNKFSTN